MAWFNKLGQFALGAAEGSIPFMEMDIRKEEEIAREERAEERYGRQSKKDRLARAISTAIGNNDLKSLERHIKTAEENKWLDLVALGQAEVVSVGAEEAKVVALEDRKTATEKLQFDKLTRDADNDQNEEQRALDLGFTTNDGSGDAAALNRAVTKFENNRRAWLNIANSPKAGSLKALKHFYEEGAFSNPDDPLGVREANAERTYNSIVGVVKGVPTDDSRRKAQHERLGRRTELNGYIRQWHDASVQDPIRRRAIRQRIIEDVDGHILKIGENEDDFPDVLRQYKNARSSLITPEGIDDVSSAEDALIPEKNWFTDVYPAYFEYDGRVIIPNWDSYDANGEAFSQTDIPDTQTRAQLNANAELFHKNHREPWLNQQQSPSGAPPTGAFVPFSSSGVWSPKAIQKEMLNLYGGLPSQEQAMEFLNSQNLSHYIKLEVLDAFNFNLDEVVSPIQEEVSRNALAKAAVGGRHPSGPGYSPNPTVEGFQKKAGVEYASSLAGGMTPEQIETMGKSRLGNAGIGAIRPRALVINEKLSNADFSSMISKVIKDGSGARKIYASDYKPVYDSYQQALKQTPIDTDILARTRKKAEDLNWTEMIDRIDEMLGALEGNDPSASLPFLDNVGEGWTKLKGQDRRDVQWALDKNRNREVPHGTPEANSGQRITGFGARADSILAANNITTGTELGWAMSRQ